MNSKRELKKGDKIRTTWQNWYTVRKVIDNIVYVYEPQGTVHIANIVKVS